MAAPGRAHRQGISLMELADRFPTEESARQWFEQTRWPDGVRCARCDGDKVTPVASGQPMPYRCRDCCQYFSVRTNSVMARSKISFRKWAFGIYLSSTNLKGVSSMKLHRDLHITQKSAWFMAHRIRKALTADEHLLEGPVEVDESYFGGREKNRHMKNRRRHGRGPAGKAPVVAMRDRTTREIRARAIEHVNRTVLHLFIAANAAEDAMVYTDEHPAYDYLPNHEAVRHSVGEYVADQAHTNGIESFWAMLKRAYHGTYHHFSPKHLQRYVDEMATRQSLREMDTADLMGELAARMVGRRLTYADLTAGGPAYPRREAGS
ncbi:MAG: IS1595 family transposase [Chloroflexota bacterium]|nr:IS1595 family transposase [Chloroflexota bacterium]